MFLPRLLIILMKMPEFEYFDERNNILSGKKKIRLESEQIDTKYIANSVTIVKTCR